MNITYIDIKSDGQAVSEAIAQTLIAIEQSQKGGYEIVKVLHGYGSHGTGGEIKKNLLNFLSLYKKQKKIKDYVCADSISLPMRKKLIDICSDLLIEKDLYNLNAGVTFVIV